MGHRPMERPHPMAAVHVLSAGLKHTAEAHGMEEEVSLLGHVVDNGICGMVMYRSCCLLDLWPVLLPEY